jgi:DNA-binding GntR family transcriptional regulator
LRLVLEPLNTKAAVRNISAAELEAAEELVRRMAAAEDIGTWVELNRQFHRVLTEASGRRRTAEILQGLQSVAALYVGVFAHEGTEKLTVANAEHQAIIEAFREGDEERAAELVGLHLRHSVDVVLDVLEGEGAEPRE